MSAPRSQNEVSILYLATEENYWQCQIVATIDASARLFDKFKIFTYVQDDIWHLIPDMADM